MWPVVALLSITIRFCCCKTDTMQPNTTIDPISLIKFVEKGCELLMYNPRQFQGDLFLSTLAIYNKLIPILGLYIKVNETNSAMATFRMIENLGGPAPIRLMCETVEIEMRRCFHWIDTEARKMKALIKHLTVKWNNLVSWVRHNKTFVFNETVFFRTDEMINASLVKNPDFRKTMAT